MPSFGFWNVDSLPNRRADERPIARLAAEFATARALDVLVLIECGLTRSSLLTAFNPETSYFAIECADRFKVLANFHPRYMERLEPPVPSDRFDIWRLSLPLQQDVLVSVVHGLDKRNNSESKQALFLEQVVSAIAYFENELGHDRSVVLGDFNSNPFEAPLASAVGMNAVMSRRIARGNPRRMLNKSYPYFYNPMWNLYGDDRKGTPASLSDRLSSFGTGSAGGAALLRGYAAARARPMHRDI